MANRIRQSVNKLTLTLSNNWLPKGWEEISRDGNDMQVVLKLGHIDPENKANPLLTSGNPTANVNGEAVSVHGIETRGTMTKFFESMTKMAESGWMKGYTPEKVGQIRKQWNTTMRSEKYDATPFVQIVRYENIEWAKEALKNQLSLRTEGFGAMKIPGADGKMTNYFDNEQVKQHISEEQRKMLGEMMEKAGEEYKDKAKEQKLNAHLGSLLGYPAVIMEMENPEYVRQEEAKNKPKPKADKNKFQGGGFDPLAGKGILPQKPKPEPPAKTIKSCLAIQAGRYLITGDLLSMVDMLPKGDTFHESLTKTDTYIEKEKVEGQMYTTKHLIPVASNYQEEGYASREQAEKILTTVIDSLKDKN